MFGATPSPPAMRQLGVVFQENSLDPLMTVWETLWLHGKLFGMSGRQIAAEAVRLLETFALIERKRDSVRTLSGGLKRRLELARALLPGPKLLLLDEPTTGLDPDSRRGFWDLLQPSRRDGLTIVMATNDVLEAERECDSIAFLSQGRLIATGSPAELKQGLKHDSVRVECLDGNAARLSDLVAAWPGVGRVTQSGRVLHVTVEEAASFVPRLFESQPAAIRSIRIEESTLEDAYFQLAGKPISPENDVR